MTTTPTPRAYTEPADERTLAEALGPLEARGFSVELVDDLDAAREAVLARIPAGASVMTNQSVTLQATGVADIVNAEDGPYESARNRLLEMTHPAQRQEAKAIAGQAEFALGSVHALTRDGTLVIASKSGSQLAAYAWGAAKVILVVGAQKLVATLDEARGRVYEHALPLEDARVLAAEGEGSRVGKILEIHQDSPGRIHVVLVRRAVGF
jgi:hypothetical protein